MTIAEKLEIINENTNKIYNAGKQTEKDIFWDSYQDGGNRRNYEYAFYGSGWTDETYSPKYPIVADIGEYMFANSQITDTKVPIILSDEESAAGHLFVNSSIKNIPSIEATSEDYEWTYAFSEAINLEHIGISGVINSEFYIQESPNLDDETLISLTHAFAINIMWWSAYFHADVVDRLFTLTMDERSPEYEGMSLYDVITEKGWII